MLVREEKRISQSLQCSPLIAFSALDLAAKTSKRHAYSGLLKEVREKRGLWSGQNEGALAEKR